MAFLIIILLFLTTALTSGCSSTSGYVSSSNGDATIGYDKNSDISLKNSYNWDNTEIEANIGQKFLSISLSLEPKDFNQSFVVLSSSKLLDSNGREFFPIREISHEAVISSNSQIVDKGYLMALVYDIPTSSNPKSIEVSYDIKDHKGNTIATNRKISVPIAI